MRLRPVDSPSSLNSFGSCKRRYWADYLAGGERPRQDSIESLMGTAVHAVIEGVLRDGEADTLTVPAVAARFHAEMKRALRGKWVAPKPERNADWAHAQGEACVANWAAFWWDNFGENKEVIAVRPEENLGIELVNGWALRGFCDAVVETDTHLVAIDWKTGGHPYKGVLSDEVHRQIGIYCSALMKEARRKKKALTGIAVYLAPGRGGRGVAFPMTFNKADDERLRNDLYTVRETMSAERKWAPTTSPLCAWCAISALPRKDPRHCAVGAEKAEGWREAHGAARREAR